MYAQQLGWLHAKPGDSSITRLDLYDNDWDDWPDDLGPVQYIMHAALQMKLGVSTDKGGLIPQTWDKVIPFAERVARFDETWEITALFEMSQAYVSEFMNGRDVLRTSPMDRWRRDQDAD